MDLLILIHRVVGYPLAFVVAPAALLTFAGAPGHRRLGKLYLYAMVFLYLTGSVVTLSHHDRTSWDFARNVVFNLTGFSLVLLGVRSMILFRRPGPVEAGRLDDCLAGLLCACAAALVALGLFRDTPMRIFALLASLLVWLEVRELRAGLRPRALLYHRHVRYILASYFYVLTVVSVVHLGDELSRDLKWLWPAAIAIFVVAATTSRSRWIWQRRRLLLRAALAVTILVAGAFGAYVGSEVVAEIRGGPAVLREP